MSKFPKIEMNGEEEVEFSGTATHDGVEDLYVGVIIKGAAIDITDLLNSKQRDHFEEMIVDEAWELEERAKDYAEQQKFEDMRDRRLGK